MTSLAETLYLILLAVVIIYPAWKIISAYNKIIIKIEGLREDVEKLKKDQQRE
jgi:hypothetical protein